MTNGKILVDASERAKIVFSNGSQPVITPTLQESVIAYAHLGSKAKKAAVIETESGMKFCEDEIYRLYKLN